MAANRDDDLPKPHSPRRIIADYETPKFDKSRLGGHPLNLEDHFIWNQN